MTQSLDHSGNCPPVPEGRTPPAILGAEPGNSAPLAILLWASAPSMRGPQFVPRHLHRPNGETDTRTAGPRRPGLLQSESTKQQVGSQVRHSVFSTVAAVKIGESWRRSWDFDSITPPSFPLRSTLNIKSSELSNGKTLNQLQLLILVSVSLLNINSLICTVLARITLFK